MKPKPTTKKETSPRQLAANRRNAKKSTGPRTAAGRAVSRMNAIKHGILSRQVLVNAHAFEEDGTELEALHRRFWEDLQPVGPVEELLVDQIVTAHWRLRRALMAESGEIALSIDSGQRRRARGTDPILQWMKWTAFGDPIHAMQSSVVGCTLIADWLGEVRTSVEVEGCLSGETVNKLAARFGGKTNSLVSQLDTFRRGADAEPEATPERKLSGALAFLDRKINGFHHERDAHMQDELQEEESSQAAAVLPSAGVLDKIMRYETKLERQLYRAMTQLERVQRMRNGEAVPAPLAIQI